ncbi:aspartate aminotransferase family protein [Paraconexibacter sp. AEG42_29]
MLLSDPRDNLLLHFARNGNTDPLLVLERGAGPYVFDTEGKAYFDGLSSLFCAQLGYSYGEEMGQVAAAQLQQLAFATVWGSAHPAAVELSHALAEILPGDLDHVFFTNGGSESVESAWKIVRQYHVARGEPQRTKAIARDIAYHGVTLGALAFTGVPGYKAQFGPPAIDVTHVANTNAFRAPDGDDEPAFCRRLLDELEATIQAEGPDTIAMLIAEPVQNAGGCLTPPAGYWPGLREICDRHGILLCADEVICGFGRLGEWLGSERYGIVPDLATTAKGLTSAYAPMGAVMVSGKVAAPLYEPGLTLMHGITFAGHPLCAAIALQNLKIFQRDNVLEQVRANEPYLKAGLDQLRGLPIVGDVRGAGYFWALELVGDDDDAQLDADTREWLLRGYLPARLLEAGLIARPDDRGDAVLHLAPPLTCTHEDIDTLVSRVGDVLADCGTELTRRRATA